MCPSSAESSPDRAKPGLAPAPQIRTSTGATKVVVNDRDQSTISWSPETTTQHV